MRLRLVRGFTLVELLVVIAIVGVLMGLLLPAVFAAREAARRTTCSANLRQIGIGLANYHATWSTFPPGGVEWRPFLNTTKKQIAWSAFLLPYIEQKPLYASLDLNAAFDSPENAAAAATVLPVYLCPSTLRDVPLIDGRGATDYAGIYGERITSPNSPPKGIMLYDMAIGEKQIEDGLSHTLIVSEDAGFSDGQWINGRNVMDQAYSINAAPEFENDIRSEHPGGANGLLADGSVRFLHEQMDLRILAALCTRAGGEVIGDF